MATNRRPLVSTLLFFFQAEDGIRDWSVTGVQTCALPIYLLAALDRAHQLLGQLDDRLVEEHVRRPVRELALDGPDDRRVGVAEQHRAGAEQVVDVPAARGVPEIRAAALAHDELEAGATAMTAENTAREHARGALDHFRNVAHDRLPRVPPSYAGRHQDTGAGETSRLEQGEGIVGVLQRKAGDRRPDRDPRGFGE